MLLVLACTDSIPLAEWDLPSGQDVPGGGLEQVPGDTSLDTDPGDTAEDTGEDPGDDDDADVVFDRTFVHRVDITLTSAQMNQLNADPYTFVDASFAYDGEAFEHVGIRVKGRYGSLRTFPSKVALKIDLKEYGLDQQLHGLESLNLNNMVQDAAKVHELAAYGANEALGIPSPRVAYGQVFVNGEDYGLYTVVEVYDDEFLQARMADPSGNLYDGDYYLYPDWSTYILVDFTAASQDYFVLDEGTDVALADVHAVTEAVAHAPDAALAELVDMDQHAAFLAAAAWTGHSDSYSYYSNNYRVYFDPARGGKAIFLPWDPDWAFYASTSVTSPYGAVSGRCFNNTDCRTAARAYVDTLSSTLPGGALQAEVEAAIDLIEPYLRADPKLESGLATIHQNQADLIDWFSRRGGELDAYGF